jgi:uncharacterized tellurite resistance protein B-like protein
MSLMRRLTGRAPSRGDSATVKRIALELEGQDEETAHFLASFAHVLARVAAADLEIDAEEGAAIERILSELEILEPSQVKLVAEIAREQAREEGGTENYLATREFRERSDRPQRLRLLRALLQVAEADGHVSEIESDEIIQIAAELDFSGDELRSLRSDLRGRA